LDSKRFGSFELDARSRELRTGTTVVRLQEQPFEILRLMLERPGQVVTREELRQRLWPEGTFVDFEHSLNAAIKRLRAALGDDAENPRFIETVPRRGYRFIAPMQDASRGPQGSAPHVRTGSAPHLLRLAVLPFTNLGEDAGQEYFADGLTEEMIAQLGQMCRGRVGVIAHSSSMTFRDTRQRARDVGHALNAGYLLEGSVRRDGHRVRITARLVEAEPETLLWTETYDRQLTDWLSVQADVAGRIARSLAVELVPGAFQQPASAVSETAYQEYLKGRYHWNKLDDEREALSASSLEQALACFTRAIEHDPAFAGAYAAAARVYVAIAQQYLDVPPVALERARSMASRALAIHPGVPEAYLALGDVRRMLDWDWRGAEEAYGQAIAVNPSQENVHRRYSLMLAVQSRTVEALREADRACELDPLNFYVRVSAALVCYFSGDYHAAIEHCEHVLELGPRYVPARRLMGAAYLQAGRMADALRALEAAHAEAPNAPIAIAWLAHARAVAGDRAGALQCLDQWRALDPSRHPSPYHLAIAHMGLGDVEAACAALQTAIDQKDPAITYLAVEPRFTPLRSDARYAQVVDRLGL
jgi:TolB-like protein/Tfp pilus assembly protein PilF